MLVACVTGLYYYLPNTRVDWRHAFMGGVVVALGLELAKKLLAVYLAQMPSLFDHLWCLFCRADFVGLDLCGLGGGAVRGRGHRQLA
jgi:hypothetical protein